MFAKLVGPPLAKFVPLTYVKSWLAQGRHSADDVNSMCSTATDYDSTTTLAAVWDIL